MSSESVSSTDRDNLFTWENFIHHGSEALATIGTGTFLFSVLSATDSLIANVSQKIVKQNLQNIVILYSVAKLVYLGTKNFFQTYVGISASNSKKIAWAAALLTGAAAIVVLMKPSNTPPLPMAMKIVGVITTTALIALGVRSVADKIYKECQKEAAV